MPAQIHSFLGEPPPVAVVDSSFVFEALLDSGQGDGRHEVSRRFAERMMQAGTRLIVSPLLFVEAPQCWRRLYRRGALLPLRPGLDEATTRRAAFEEATALLRLFLESFDYFQFPFSRRVTDSATSLAGFYNLQAHDAVHVALTRVSGVPDLVSLDSDFRRVDGLRLWCPVG